MNWPFNEIGYRSVTVIFFHYSRGQDMILVNSFKDVRVKTCNKPWLTPSPALGAAKGATLSSDV